MNENIIYKKKQVDPCPNKLFISWMEEITKKAKKNKDQSYFTYKKALKSMKMFPLPVKSGKDFLILEGFGDKTCALLDKMLSDLAKNQGISVSKALKIGNEQFANNPKNTKRSALPKESSESYSLMLGLYDIQNNDLNGGSQEDIIPNALKYYQMAADSNPKKLWKDMKKLVKNGIVVVIDNRYRLSSYGKVLCDQLLQKRCNVPCDHDIEKVKTSTTLEAVNRITNESNKQMKPHGLSFFYCKSLDPNTLEMVNRKCDAASKMIDHKLYYRIKVKYDDLIQSNVDYHHDLDALLLNDDFMFAFLHDTNAPEFGCFVQEETKRSSPLEANPIVRKKSKRSDITTTQITNPSNDLDDNLTILNECQINRCSDNELRSAFKQRPQRIHSEAVSSCNDESSKILFTMPSGSFEVILIVDNRENYGTGKLKEHLCSDLIKKAVKLETRVLPIGDFVWIAKDNVGREAVLDVIVERKRYDDLAKSITDNRFRDQKLRMKRSGISRIIYLIEKCKGMKNLAISVDTLHQAIINSQIHDHCDVKITENAADTIAYLSSLHKKICKIYSDKSIHVYHNDIPHDQYSFNPFDPSIVRPYSAIEFASFTESGQKTKPIRISEMFAKHVNCIHGITVERSRALIDKYAVPRLLMEAYNGCHDEKECQLLLSKIKLTSNKPFGLAQSKSIYAAYNRK